MANHIFDFTGGDTGRWKVLKMETIVGEPLFPISHLEIAEGKLEKSNKGIWNLKGFVSNLRYTEKVEKHQLAEIQPMLGRDEATCAALIPIKKSETWWNMAQD